VNPHVCAIIPALNEEATIANVVENLLNQQVSTVLVVDNGSTDATQSRAEKAGAIVVAEPRRGYGRACLTGIEHLPEKTEWVLFCDADGSDDLRDLPQFWDHLAEADLLLGNRRATAEGRANLTPVQNFGNWLSGFLMKLGWGKGFQDLGPLRMISRDQLRALNMQDENFGWTVEIQAKALEQGLKWRELPVNELPRQGGVSKISGNFKASCQAGTIILKTLGSLWIQRSVVQSSIKLLSSILLVLGAALMGFSSDPASTTQGAVFFLSAGLLSVGFILALCTRSWTALWLLSLGALTRLLLLPMPPGDDIWRYLWEGLVLTEGLNPYNLPPNSENLAELRTDWSARINHPEVTAIYPPLAQLLFAVLGQVSLSVLFFKVCITLADFAIGYLLYRRHGQRAALYLLNPMVLYCFAGGAHYESFFLLPLVSAWLLWEPSHLRPQRLVWIGLLIGASISLKIVSLLAAGFIGWRLLLSIRSLAGLSRLGIYLGALALPPLLSYALLCGIAGVPQTLYPSDFAETARSTSLIPWLAEFFNDDPHFPIENDRFLLPLLIVLVPITLFSRSLAGFQSRSFLALLAFSPMVHAWYLTWLAPFSLRRHPLVICAFSLTGFLYFLLPYRLATAGVWELSTAERLLFWAPLLLLVPLRRRPRSSSQRDN